jgi:hypothetical protein
MSENSAEAVEQQPPAKPFFDRFKSTKFIAAASAVGGMAFGGLVEMGVQTVVQSTGLLGPSVETMIAEQDANLSEIGERLAALQGASSDPEVRRNLAELRDLMERQSELANQASTELRYLGEQVSTLREQRLADTGYSGGADFWLKNGESVNVGDASQVFGVLRIWGNGAADVNLNGARQRVAVGDTVAVESEANPCTVFYKQATPRQDGRIGFDVTCG